MMGHDSERIAFRMTQRVLVVDPATWEDGHADIPETQLDRAQVETMPPSEPETIA